MREGGGDNGTWIAQNAQKAHFGNFSISSQEKKVRIQKQVKVILLVRIDVAYC